MVYFLDEKWEIAAKQELQKMTSMNRKTRTQICMPYMYKNLSRIQHIKVLFGFFQKKFR